MLIDYTCSFVLFTAFRFMTYYTTLQQLWQTDHAKTVFRGGSSETVVYACSRTIAVCLQQQLMNVTLHSLLPVGSSQPYNTTHNSRVYACLRHDLVQSRLSDEIHLTAVLQSTFGFAKLRLIKNFFPGFRAPTPTTPGMTIDVLTDRRDTDRVHRAHRLGTSVGRWVPRGKRPARLGTRPADSPGDHEPTVE